MIKVDQLKFGYGDGNVLESVSLSVKKGKFVCVIGPNGSGKTTLIKNICKLLKPSSGSIYISGLNILKFKQKDFAKRVAVVHQGSNSAFDFNVEEAVLMGRYPHLKRFQNESASDREIALDALRQTDTLHLKDKSLHTISGGERQRVMIAKALAQEPELLVLDEPISNLDIKYQVEILKLCQKLNQTKGITIFMTLHDINLASRFADEVVMMKNGKISQVGNPVDVITEDNIKFVYDVDVKVQKSPFPMVIPV